MIGCPYLMSSQVWAKAAGTYSVGALPLIVLSHSTRTKVCLLMRSDAAAVQVSVRSLIGLSVLVSMSPLSEKRLAATFLLFRFHVQRQFMSLPITL